MPNPIFSFFINNDLTLSLVIDPIALLILLIIISIIYFVISYFIQGNKIYEIDELEIGTGTGKVSIKPNRKDQEIAYKIWVELSTRKIGLSIDLKDDVITEIYDSWHNFFSITRELIKDIPVSKVQGDSTRKIITLSINLLNNGLRPHLTNWQARFRHWYNKQLEKTSDEDIDPQVIQSRYPHFKELQADLMEVNEKLINYRNRMREVVLGLEIHQVDVVNTNDDVKL